MMFFDPVVNIRKTSWRRLQMLVAEMEYLNKGEELSGLNLDHECERFVQLIIDEYVRQYFEESTRSAAQLLSRRQETDKIQPRFWLR